MVSTRTPINYTNLIVLIAAGLLFLSYGYTEMAGADLWWDALSAELERDV